MPKSFSLNALYRPILASLVAVSAFAPSATRAAEQPPFLQVMDFDSVMALPEDAREKYMGLLRETLVYMAESDAGTDHEFFGANDLNAPIVMNGWQGGYYAILNAFISPANAAIWPFNSDDPLTYEKYLEQRALLLNKETVTLGRSNNNREGERTAALKKLDLDWQAQEAANKVRTDAEPKLTAQTYEQRKKAYEKDIADANKPAKTYGQVRAGERAEEGLKKLEENWAITKNAPKAGEKNNCPPLYYALKNCFVAIDDKVVGFMARSQACKAGNGVMARPDSTIATASNIYNQTNDAQCLTKPYFDKMKEKDWVEETRLMAGKENLCIPPELKCGNPKNLKPEERDKFAKLVGNRCIYAGTVSQYKNVSKSERKGVRKGMCEGKRDATFGGVKVACDSASKDQVICNPLIFDTAEPLPANAAEGTAEKPVTVKGRCVARRSNSTELCKNSFDEANKDRATNEPNRFWNSKLPGIREEFNKLTGVMNETCSSSVARGIQCKECDIMQKGLMATKLIAKSCTTTTTAAAKPGATNQPATGPKNRATR